MVSVSDQDSASSHNSSPEEEKEEQKILETTASQQEEKTQNSSELKQKEDIKNETVFSLPEQEVPEIKEEEKREEDENLLIENDGDFFWILQRVLWGILKTAIIVGSLAFLVWLIWHSGEKTEDTVSKKSSKQTEVSVKDSQNTPISKPITVEPNITENHGIIATAQWASWMERMQIYEQENTLLFSLHWLRRASAFFSVPTGNLVQGVTREERQKNVNAVLSELQEILEEASRLQPRLQEEISQFSITAVSAKANVEANDRSLLSSIQAFRSDIANVALEQKILAQKIMYENASRIEVYQMVVKYMQSYNQFLRSTYENIFANQKAIVEDVQIVVFPNDPFRRMITPAEWRMRQGN